MKLQSSGVSTYVVMKYGFDYNNTD